MSRTEFRLAVAQHSTDRDTRIAPGEFLTSAKASHCAADIRVRGDEWVWATELATMDALLSKVQRMVTEARWR